MMCSFVRQNSLFVGCRDGTLLEINTKTVQLVREMQTGFCISTIQELEKDVLILGQNIGSGWAEARGQISIVRLVNTNSLKMKKEPDERLENGFRLHQTLAIPVGDINQILVNPTTADSSDTIELILACQNGVFAAILSKLKESMKKYAGEKTKAALQSFFARKTGFHHLFNRAPDPDS